MSLSTIIAVASGGAIGATLRLLINGVVKYHFLPTIEVKQDDDGWFDKLRDDMQKVIDDEFIDNHSSR